MADSRDGGDGGRGLNVWCICVVVGGVLCVAMVGGLCVMVLVCVLCVTVVGGVSIEGPLFTLFDGLIRLIAPSPTTERCTNTRSDACLTFEVTSSSPFLPLISL